MKHRFNAYLQFQDITGNTNTFAMWVMQYTQAHQLAGQEYQSKLFKHFYPRSYSPGDMMVTGRVPYQNDYDNLAEFIRSHQITMMGQPGLSNIADGNSSSTLSLMILGIPSEGIEVSGIVKQFQAGAKRFNVAPEFQFNFFIVQDRHSTLTEVPLETLSRVWSGDYVALPSNNNNLSNPVINNPLPPIPHGI